MTISVTPLQALAAEDVDDFASTDDCTVRSEYVDGHDLPVGQHGEKSIRVRRGSVRLVLGRIGSFLLDEQCVSDRFRVVEPSSDRAGPRVEAGTRHK